jgi:hypothetical protein
VKGFAGFANHRDGRKDVVRSHGEIRQGMKKKYGYPQVPKRKVFITNLYLASCDSVHKRPHVGIRKRFVCGLLLAQRVILTPPMVIDNEGLDELFADPLIIRYLGGRPGRLILRHYHNADVVLVDYFRELDGGFIVSNGGSGPCRKYQMSAAQRFEMEQRPARLDRLLGSVYPLTRARQYCTKRLVRGNSRAPSGTGWSRA